ncbi:MAG: hypothetical protein ACR2MX_01165 [Cyclobacteriaceae bacterium]
MLSRIYFNIRVLSLDVVLGACCSALFLASFLNVELPKLILLTLALAVWVIYTTDHLIDAYKINKSASSARHAFHQKHFKVMLAVVLLATGIALYLVTLIPSPTRSWGFYLVGMVLVYFAILTVWKQQSLFFKEVMVALVYTGGIFIGPLTALEVSIPFKAWLLFTQFAVLAFVNLLEFSFYEQNIDRSDGQGSIVLKIGRRRTQRVIWICLVLLLLSTGPLIIGFWQDLAMIKAQALVFLMSLTMASIMLFKEFFKAKERYRMLGDGAFIFPVFFI